MLGGGTSRVRRRLQPRSSRWSTDGHRPLPKPAQQWPCPKVHRVEIGAPHERVLSVSSDASLRDVLKVTRLEPQMAAYNGSSGINSTTQLHLSYNYTFNCRTVLKVIYSVEQPPSDPTSARWGRTIQRAHAPTDKTGYPLRSGARHSKKWPSNIAPASLAIKSTDAEQHG